jgi:hypothetical protein
MKSSKLYFLFFLIVLACTPKEKSEDCGTCGINMNRIEIPETPEEAILQKKEIDTSTTGNAEFKENKKKIEAIYGEQWDFCKCVVLNDSLDKAAKNGDMDDKFMDRFEEVDKRCKSFLVMDNIRTPEEREKHDKKINKCLKEVIDK